MSLLFSFTNLENRRAEQVLPRGDGRNGEEEVGKGHGRVKYSANTVHTCKQMEKWDMLKLFQEWWEGGIKRMVEEVNSSMVYLIYYKNTCKCHNVPPPSTIKKERIL
jgi:hypothetical protein